MAQWLCCTALHSTRGGGHGNYQPTHGMIMHGCQRCYDIRRGKGKPLNRHKLAATDKAPPRAATALGGTIRKASHMSCSAHAVCAWLQGGWCCRCVKTHVSTSGTRASAASTMPGLATPPEAMGWPSAAGRTLPYAVVCVGCCPGCVLGQPSSTHQKLRGWNSSTCGPLHSFNNSLYRLRSAWQQQQQVDAADHE